MIDSQLMLIILHKEEAKCNLIILLRENLYRNYKLIMERDHHKYWVNSNKMINSIIENEIIKFILLFYKKLI